MSHSTISSLGGQRTVEYELVHRSNEGYDNDSRIGAKEPNYLSKAVSPVKGEPVSRWGLGWKTPATMIVLYIIAFSAALGHCVFFMRLNGKSADTLPQTYVATISHLLGNIFRASLCGALAVAFTQHLWRILRTTSVKVSEIELLYTVRNNLFLLAHPGVVKTTPLLFLLAVFIWTIPLAVIYPPGALTVVPFAQVNFRNTLVPTFNATQVVITTNMTETRFNAGTQSLANINYDEMGNMYYASAKQQGKGVGQQTLTTRRISTTTSPCGTNCTFQLEFVGPYVQCTEHIFNQSFPHNDTNLFNYYSAGWTSSLVDDPPDLPLSFFNLSTNLTRPFGTYVSDSGDNMLVSEVTQLQCLPGCATYLLHTSYVNGIRELSYTAEYLGALQDPDNYGLAGVPQSAKTNLARYGVINLFALTDSFVDAISGTYPADLVFDPSNESSTFPYDMPSFAPATNFTDSNGTLINLMSDYFTFWEFFWMEPSKTIISQTNFNLAYNNFTARGPVLSISQDMINEALANITLSMMYTFPLWNTTVEANITTYINIYSLTSPLNLYLPYAFCLALAIPFLLLGANSLRLNGVTAIDGGFVQILTTTTGNRGLEDAAAGGCLGGSENTPRELMDMKIRFGELVGQDDEIDKGGVKRAGFGTEDEVVSLRKRTVYGR